MRHVSLRIKFSVLFAAVVLVALPLYVVWNQHVQNERAQQEMLEKAQILTQEMDAVWQFMEVNQDRMKSAEDMGYATDDLYCVIAAKSVSKLFTVKSDYVIHYTNLETRRMADAPDEFETEALRALHADADVVEYYALTDYKGHQAFRYVKPIYATESCLECHGEPKGEIDRIGFPKEGIREGDIAGAISIVMPVDLYMDAVRASTGQQIAFYSVVLIAGVAAIWIAVTRLVTGPLGKLKAVSHRIEEGDYDVDFSNIGDRDEIADVSLHLGSMVGELRALNAGLEEIVGERTAELATTNAELRERRAQLEQVNSRLEAMNARLQDEVQYKSDFLAIMSHELRTPLTSIIASTELWLAGGYDFEPDEVDIVNEIKINGQLLLEMINNILEMARIEANRVTMHYEYVDLVDLIQMVVYTLAPLAQAKDQALSTAVARDVPIIQADWEKLRRVLENLISNAIKFTKREGSICVGAEPADAATVRIFVRDTGVGIAAEDLPTIFDRFRQADRSAGRRYRGSGLGLSVVRELVDLHGGRVEVQSEPKVGTTFSVFVPVSQEKGKTDEDLAGR